MLYFAYGSNMDFGQMRHRCPSAKFVGIAKLPQHRLAFTRLSRNRNCGVADAVPDTTANMWGVVFDIDQTEFAGLDKSEGFVPGRPLDQNAYYREERHVWRDGNENTPLLASVYFANRQTDPPLPNADYKKLIVEGSRFWHLPDDYRRDLEAIAIA